MPQLDIVTFFGQTFSVYFFFIIQYVIVSTVSLPWIYQILVFKNLLFKNLLGDIIKFSTFFKNSFIFLETSALKFDFKPY